MHIVYAVTTCSDKVYKQLFSETRVKPAFQSQKYHRLLIEGLAAHTEVDVAASPPVNRSVLNSAFVRLPEETEGGARYHYIPAIRNPLVKLAAVAAGTFWKTLRYSRKDSAVVVDCLNRTTAFFALLAAKVRGCRCVGIITDLPDMLSGGSFSVKMANYVIRHCTDYVLLTEAMNDYIQNNGKPYVVLEGHSDISMRDLRPGLEKKTSPRSVFYAGGVSKQYGLADLVEGFRLADLPNARLEIYGPGDYVPELQKIAEEDSRIFYGGMLMNSEIVEREQQATLLVNPRPTHEEFVKYSFPSKTMEYMASGTPVLTTRLPGMPKEYYPYVSFIDEETAEGIAAALKAVLAMPDEDLFQMGKAAREFVLESRNNVVQARKLLDMLEMEKDVKK
ncbi:MAG: glycosyltransferase family 4 protein [Oscillospiraceae bacterium]|nr:glycosyltransferase family 4 protein [Oscillospiraceae bacterium]